MMMMMMITAVVGPYRMAYLGECLMLSIVSQGYNDDDECDDDDDEEEENDGGGNAHDLEDNFLRHIDSTVHIILLFCVSVYEAQGTICLFSLDRVLDHCSVL